MEPDLRFGFCVLNFSGTVTQANLRYGHTQALCRLALCCLAIVGGARCAAQTPIETLCADTRLTGSVTRGERFEAPFGDSLKFVLEPSIGPPNPDGWTIRVVGSDPAHDYLMVATPPYRFGNPRYLDTSCGYSATEAVSWTPRLVSSFP